MGETGELLQSQTLEEAHMLHLKADTALRRLNPFFVLSDCSLHSSLPIGIFVQRTAAGISVLSAPLIWRFASVPTRT
jgi:hypothetical protein